MYIFNIYLLLKYLLVDWLINTEIQREDFAPRGGFGPLVWKLFRIYFTFFFHFLFYSMGHFPPLGQNPPLGFFYWFFVLSYSYIYYFVFFLEKEKNNSNTYIYKYENQLEDKGWRQPRRTLQSTSDITCLSILSPNL